MPIPVHVICGKCGSLEIRLETRKPHDEEGFGVFFCCNNCNETTSVESINEWKLEQFKGY